MNRYFTIWCLAAVLSLSLGARAQDTNPLLVIATVPELGSLAREIGGDQVSVEVLAKPTEDPHFVEPRPSHIKRLNRADLYIQTGMDLEVGWAPPLLQNARNPDVLPGAPGYLDASTGLSALEVPDGTVDRSMGDIHAYGNPHYLSDPLEGLRVAALIRDRMIALRPDERTYFEERYRRFATQLAEALVGKDLVEIYGVEEVPKLARLHAAGRLGAFLDAQGQREQLGGWLGVVIDTYGIQSVDDHAMWPYFARRFGIRIAGHMEPKPGVPPTTRHLQELVTRMRAERIPLILSSAYYNPRHVGFLVEQTDAVAVPLAHQSGAIPGTENYLSMVDYNVNRLVEALARP